MQFSRPNSHAIALRISFGAAACAGVCSHFAGWFVVFLWLCVLCWRKAPGELLGAVRLRSDLELFVPGCRSLPECLHLYRLVWVKDQTVSITRETHPVAVFFFLLLRAILIFLLSWNWDVTVICSYSFRENFLWRTESSFGNWKERLRGQTKPTIIVLWKYITA